MVIEDTGARVYYVVLRHDSGVAGIRTVGLSGQESAVRAILAAENAPESAIVDQGIAECEWFAGCTEEAMSLHPHPVFGHVPTCRRHLQWIEDMRSE